MSSSKYNIYFLFAILPVLFFVDFVNAKEWSIESHISTRLQHNDNVFLTNNQKVSSTGFFVIPKSSLTARESNWNTALDASIRSNNYDDSELNSNDIVLSANGNYIMERNIFSLTGNYIKDSNISTTSSTFGLADTRVKSESAVYSPSYTRLLTRRLQATMGYTHSSITYSDAENARFVPSKSDTLNATLTYNITELHDVTANVAKTEFINSDRTTQYDLITYRIGFNSKLSETLTSNITIGSSKNDILLQRTIEPFDFFGTTIIQNFEDRFSNRNSIYDASITSKYQTMTITVNLGKDIKTDSFGNLNTVESGRFAIDKSLSGTMGYMLNVNYAESRSISENTTFTDRDTLVANTSLYYNFGKDWRLNTSYRYSSRDFKDEPSSGNQHSNVVSISLIYKFPALSTY